VLCGGRHGKSLSLLASKCYVAAVTVNHSVSWLVSVM